MALTATITSSAKGLAQSIGGWLLQRCDDGERPSLGALGRR